MHYLVGIASHFAKSDAVADTEGGHGPPRSPRPNFAVAKVCRIQGWKNAILKIPSF